MPARAASRPYRLDPERTVFVFSATYLGFITIQGRFTDFEGRFIHDPRTRRARDIHIRINAASVETGDIVRDRHLRGSDFFNAKHFPVISFKGGSSSFGEPCALTVTGDFTLRGVTRPLTLTAVSCPTIENKNPRRIEGLVLRGTINRGEYGMDGGAMNLFIGEDIDLEVTIDAVREW